MKSSSIHTAQDALAHQNKTLPILDRARTVIDANGGFVDLYHIDDRTYENLLAPMQFSCVLDKQRKIERKLYVRTCVFGTHNFLNGYHLGA